jgi:hypothetical protein
MDYGFGGPEKGGATATLGHFVQGLALFQLQGAVVFSPLV